MNTLTITYNRVWIRNFKSIEDLELTLNKLNVLVGPNGSGKTNIVEAFLMARLVVKPTAYHRTHLHLGGVMKTLFS